MSARWRSSRCPPGAAADPNRLELIEPQASQLFAALREDVDLTDPRCDVHAVAQRKPCPAADGHHARGTRLRQGPPAGRRGQRQRRLPPGPRRLHGCAHRQRIYPGRVLLGQPGGPDSAVLRAGFADVAADVAALFGIPAAQVPERPGWRECSSTSVRTSAPEPPTVPPRCRPTWSTRRPAMPCASRSIRATSISSAIVISS